MYVYKFTYVYTCVYAYIIYIYTDIIHWQFLVYSISAGMYHLGRFCYKFWQLYSESLEGEDEEQVLRENGKGKGKGKS